MLIINNSKYKKQKLLDKLKLSCYFIYMRMK